MLHYRCLIDVLTRFARQKRGSVAIIFAFSIAAILGVAALGINYSEALSRRATLNAAADSAALAAVGMSGRAQGTADAEATARKIFMANIANLTSITLDTLNVSVTDTAGNRAVVVSYAATYQTAININGPVTFALNGEAQAAGPAASYVDFYLLLDNTPSMGLGATTNDINKMVANTADQCAFACHEMDKPGTDYYSLARGLGVALRIDVVRSATQTLMDTASAQSVRANQFRMAIYTFGTKAEVAGLSEIQPITSSLSSAKSAAAAIDLMTIPYQNYKGDTQTDFDSAFALINAKIASPGDGSTAGAPKKVLFYVSDGLNDANKAACTGSYLLSGDGTTGVNYDRCIEPLNPALCDTLKSRGITVAVLYTSYLPLPTAPFYNDYVSALQPNIAPKMKACSSDGLFFEVAPNQGISEAMNALFLKTLRTVSLTR